MGSRRVGHDWATSLSLFTFVHWRRKWQPTPVFFPGESQGRGSLVGCRLWGRTESDTTEATQQQQFSMITSFIRNEDDRGWEGWMASLTQWTWVWASSGRWWWTEKPGMLQSMGLQRVGHDWVTDLNWLTSFIQYNLLKIKHPFQD